MIDAKVGLPPSELQKIAKANNGLVAVASQLYCLTASPLLN